MSVSVADSCFLSALQPRTSCTAYVVPPDGPCLDPGARARRVREQVRMRLAENRSSSLPRLDDTRNGSTDHNYPEAKSFSNTLGFSSRSMIHTPSRVMAMPTAPLRSSGFSSRSAVETSSKAGYKQTSEVQSSFRSSHRRNTRSKSLCQADQEAPAITVLPPPENASYLITVPPMGTLRRSLSGTLAQERGYWQEEEQPNQYTYKGPSHRTISRITNRQQHYQQQQPSSTFGQEGWVGTGRGVPMAGDSWGTQWQQHVSRASHGMGTGQYQTSIHRAPSLRSLRSVGKGVDILDGASIHSNDPLEDMQSLDMATAVQYLSESDAALQVLGAAYIQHKCYHSNEAKNQVRFLHGVPALVQLLFSSDNQEVQRFSTGATRNLIYENADNKAALIDAGGVMRLVSILGQPDQELRKTITGVLWNLSSRDNLKEKLSKEALSELTENVLIPLCSSFPLSASERDIFYNTSGCLRNLSSVNERTRRKMRDMQGLVDSLVSYIQQEDRGDDKGLENSLCVMRNLSYQLYAELPPSVRLRLEGQTRASASGKGEAIGCFTLYNKKDTQNQTNRAGALKVSIFVLKAKNMVSVLVSKLPSDGLQKTPSSEVVINICGALNNLVTCSSLAARNISYFHGLPKLIGIKTMHDNSSGSVKAARAASTVLCNMFQYNKLHKDYKQKGFARRDFADVTI
ncbi:plakophilin-3-like [Pungitius pungitius]|uniref:plakophilin-3-like n=1 Tax=Pungitius pungitius TaxID=134920 RepID=UPI002E154FD0